MLFNFGLTHRSATSGSLIILLRLFDPSADLLIYARDFHTVQTIVETAQNRQCLSVTKKATSAEPHSTRSSLCKRLFAKNHCL